MKTIEAIAAAFIFIGLILAMNENTSTMCINVVGTGLAVLGMMILRITGKDAR